MKHLKYLILESVSIDDIYSKYYFDIDREEFDQIVKSDPTHISNKRNGKYIQWLLKLYKQDKLKLEDLYKATEYLEIFDRKSVKNKLERKDINQYSDIVDLFKAIQPFKDSKEILSKSEIKNSLLVKEFKNFNLYIPETYEDSCILGKGTEWCTATEKTRKHFDYYTSKGKLYILISKNNPIEKYQFHFDDEQFMDKDDDPINILDFFNQNPDVGEYFGKFLEYLDVSNQNLTSLKGIENLISLKYLYCDDNQLTSLKDIENLTNLEFLNCGNNKISSIEYINDFKNLKSLSCHNNNLSSLKGVENLINLTRFDCSNNRITSLNKLSKLKKLTFLDCSNNEITKLDGIYNLTNLTNLDCQSNKITSLKGIDNLVNLEKFYFDKEKIIFFDGIDKLTKLKNFKN